MTGTTSYYGQPILKQPVWTWEIPTYFFFGGVAGASSLIALGGRATGNDDLARSARALAAAMAAASPALLISDLGRPKRFHHMLRVARPTSPMNIGSWLLAAYVPSAVGAWLLGRGQNHSTLSSAVEVLAAVLAPGMTTYTAVLVADTAIPVWHEARRELPFVFAGSALTGAAALLAGRGHGATPHNLAMMGSGLELAATGVMEARLGDTGRPYKQSNTGILAKAAKMLSVLGISVGVFGRRSNKARMAGSLLMLGGAICERWSVFRAGFDSAADPEYVVQPQRQRLGERR